MAPRQMLSPYSLLFLAAMGTGAAPPASDAMDSDMMAMIKEEDENNQRHLCAGRGARRRYALLMAARDSDHVKEKYGGYRNVFAAAFGDQADHWDRYLVIDGKFPRPEDLELYDGFVISGSASDAYGDEPWVLELCALVRDLFYRVRKRVLGVCFGHQLICRALGGEVRKARKGWDIGVTDVKVELPEGKDGNGTPWWFLQDLVGESPATCRRSASIIQVHQDEVCEVPQGAEVIARSDRTGIEMFHYGGRVLGIQGHPEYSKDILDDIIDRLVRTGVIQALRETRQRCGSPLGCRTGSFGREFAEAS